MAGSGVFFGGFFFLAGLWMPPRYMKFLFLNFFIT